MLTDYRRLRQAATHHDRVMSLPARITRQDGDTSRLDQEGILTTPDLVCEFDVVVSQGIVLGQPDGVVLVESNQDLSPIIDEWR